MWHTCTGKMINDAGFWWVNLKEKDNLGDPGLRRRVMLNGCYRNTMRSAGLNLSSSGQGQLASCCEYGNEPSGFITFGQFLDYVPEP
jgi:hypothetical protein